MERGREGEPCTSAMPFDAAELGTIIILGSCGPISDSGSDFISATLLNRLTHLDMFGWAARFALYTLPTKLGVRPWDCGPRIPRTYRRGLITSRTPDRPKSERPSSLRHIAPAIIIPAIPRAESDIALFAPLWQARNSTPESFVFTGKRLVRLALPLDESILRPWEGRESSFPMNATAVTAHALSSVVCASLRMARFPVTDHGECSALKGYVLFSAVLPNQVG